MLVLILKFLVALSCQVERIAKDIGVKPTDLRKIELLDDWAQNVQRKRGEAHTRVMFLSKS